MNWTGGSRARNNRSSSNTTRLQKRYFAKVRAAQASIPFSHAGSPFDFGDEGASVGGKRRGARIPDLDIIVPRGRNQLGEVLKKRKLFGTPGELPLIEGSSQLRTATQTSCLQGSGDEKQGNELKTKKQLLLEKDDWVCTTLSRPLVLKRTATRRTGSSNHRETVQDPVGPGGAGPHALSFTGYPSLERRSVEYVDTEEGGSSRFGNRAFRNLSDGGYVQIGGSTQSELNGKNPPGREMSHISEETMLFDLDGPQEYGSPSRPSPVRSIPTRDSNPFGRDHRIASPRVDLGKKEYYLGGYANWDPVRHGAVKDGFPSSPLTPYSFNINDLKLPPHRDYFSGESPEQLGLIEEIEEAAADVLSSSPSTILSTIHIRPESVPSPLLGTSLQPIDNTQGRAEHQDKLRYRYPTHVEKAIVQPSRQKILDLKELEEEIEITQNPSLIAYASSGSSSSNGDENDNWMLGSHLPPELCRGYETINSAPSAESPGNWGALFKTGIGDGDDSMEIRHGERRYDAEKYLEEVGIWEKHPGNIDEELVEDHSDASESEDDIGPYEQADDIAQATRKPGTKETDDERAQNTTLSNPFPCPGKKDEGEPWRDFVIGPLNSFDDTQKGAIGGEFVSRKLEAVDSRGDSPVVNHQIGERLVFEQAECQVTSDKSGLPLELDKDEDRAWRMFVFDGLGDENEEDLNPVKPPKKLPRISAIGHNSGSRLFETTSPEPQLPSPLAPTSSGPLDTPSVAGATMGSGSSNSGTGVSVASSSPVRRKSKFFAENSSSPAASPVALVATKSERPRTFEWKSGKNLYLDLLSMNTQKKSRKRRKENEGGRYHLRDEVEDIEEW